MKTINQYINEKHNFIVKGHTIKQKNMEYVDLGLPSGNLWATCNFGAKSPEGAGDFYAWGETEPKQNYDWSTYKFGDPNYGEFTKYNFKDKKTELDLEDDVVHIKFKNDWHIPTKKDIDELTLSDKTDYKFIDDYKNTGMNGLLIKSKVNNNELFLPLSGVYVRDILKRKKERTLYMTRDLADVEDYNYKREWALEVTNTDYDCDWDVVRKNGCQIRPVKYNK